MNKEGCIRFIRQHFRLPNNAKIIIFRGYNDCDGIKLDCNILYGIRKKKNAKQKGNRYIKIGVIEYDS